METKDIQFGLKKEERILFHIVLGWTMFHCFGVIITKWITTHPSSFLLKMNEDSWLLNHGEILYGFVPITGFLLYKLITLKD